MSALGAAGGLGASAWSSTRRRGSANPRPHGCCGAARRGAAPGTRLPAPPRATATLAGVPDEPDAVQRQEPQYRVRRSLRDICAVGVPEMGSACVEPAVSFLETAIVGRMGAVYLAALGPGTAFFLLVSEMCSAAGVCTTSAISLRSAKRSKEGVGRLMTATMAVSTAFGLVMTLVMLAVMNSTWWTSSLDPSLAGAVRTYVAVRLLGTTPFFLSCVAEGCYLGLRNAITPFWIFSLSGVITAVLMLLFTQPWGGFNLGFAGAALATTLGQVVGAAVFLVALHRRGYVTVSRPRWGDAWEVFGRASAVLVGTTARMLTYNALTLAAATMGIIPAAAHKIAYEGYWFMSFLTEPAFTAAVALIPKNLVAEPAKARHLARVIFGFGVGVGALLSVFAWAFCHTPLFTQDIAVLAQLRQIAPFLSSMIFFSSAVYALEGILMACRSERYLAAVHSVNCCVVSCWALYAARAGMGVEALWGAMVFYQALRLAEHFVRFRVTRPFLSGRGA